MCARMDKPSANTAVAHKLARMGYYMLTRGEEFVDQGQQRYEELQLVRSVAALKRRASALGFVITPATAGTSKSGSQTFQHQKLTEKGIRTAIEITEVHSSFGSAQPARGVAMLSSYEFLASTYVPHWSA